MSTKFFFKKDLTAIEDDSKLLDGECVIDESVSIDTANKLIVQRQTMMHEVMHAIGFYTGIKALIEEESVTTISNILFDVLSTNPELEKFLFKNR